MQPENTITNGGFNKKNEGETRVALCAVNTEDDLEKVNYSVDELERLVYTAGGTAVFRMIQTLDSPSPATYFGSGKLSELSYYCENEGINLVVFDDELSPSQIRNIENSLPDEVNCIDRSMLILDIFAKNASTKEGKLQIELAQLKYTVPRIIGKGKDMSRLAGGIGTRGPGESKLETDRRHIERRIYAIKKALATAEKNRANTRKKRSDYHLKRCAIIGYTNAGKSTLLNKLTGAGILTEDKLFATLDTTTRKFDMRGGYSILLTDTVGFISNLPHHLIESFKSTLEEAKESDFLIFVIDGSDPNHNYQIEVTKKLLYDLEISGKDIIYVVNKCDRESNILTYFKPSDNEKAVYVSALTGENLDKLIEIIIKECRSDMKYATLVFSQNEGKSINEALIYGAETETEYLDDRVRIKGYFPQSIIGKYQKR